MRTTFITLILLFSLHLQAQHIKWQEEAKLTYVYEITYNEALKFLQYSPKDRGVIFCEKIPIGTYEYNIELLPRYSGAYYLNPAKAEMMYFPVIYSNNNERRVRIF
ncbi:MAG: hypothetical protein FWF65_05915 [Bacteroidetes bacterium]|nr:hypothetical protein [Bacteroidota bacterium]